MSADENLSPQQFRFEERPHESDDSLTELHAFTPQGHAGYVRYDEYPPGRRNKPIMNIDWIEANQHRAGTGHALMSELGRRNPGHVMASADMTKEGASFSRKLSPKLKIKNLYREW